jgi:hypothetical protein
VTSYYEPSPTNQLQLVGGNRSSHQIFVAHQIRLINTILGSLRGLMHKKPLEMARQNAFISESDLQHLLNIGERLFLAELVDAETKTKLEDELVVIFRNLFPPTLQTSFTHFPT